MRNLLCSLLCVLSILYASAAAAENLTGEVTIDGVSFVLNAAVLNPETDVAARYTVTGRKWGDEPKDTFDIGLFLKHPEDAEITYRGEYGEREYTVGETFNRRFDESLRFDVYGLQYETFFGRGRSGQKRFSYTDLTARVMNPYGKQAFESVYRARNPQPGDVPDLEGITYAQALAAIESYRDAIPGGVAIGEPYYVEAWSNENVLAFERSFGDDLLQSEIDEILAAPDYYAVYLRTYVTNAPGLRGLASLTEWRPTTFDDEDVQVNEVSAMAVVSANGVERFWVEPYVANFERKGELSPILSAQEAFDRVQQAQSFFNLVDGFAPDPQAIQSKFTLVEIAPEFFMKASVPYDGTYTLIPVWAFHVHVEQEVLNSAVGSVFWDGMREATIKRDEYTVFAIDAVTGKRVL